MDNIKAKDDIILPTIAPTLHPNLFTITLKIGPKGNKKRKKNYSIHMSLISCNIQ